MSNKTSTEAVGKRICELRKKNNETQNDLATIISSKQTSISKIEKGEMRLTFENMILIADHYNVSLDYLCKGEGGINLLDTLNTYIKFEYSKISGVSDDNATHSIPILKINSSYYHYLTQTARARSDSNIPDTIRTEWLELETTKFIEQITDDSYSDFISVVPVKDTLIQSNNDFLQAVEKKLND